MYIVAQIKLTALFNNNIQKADETIAFDINVETFYVE